MVSISEGQNKQGGYTTLANIFVGLMILATIRSLISYFIFKERNLIIENEAKLSNLRELKAKAELKSLQSQINPHFLYNSLNSIASLAPIDAAKTQQMAHSLSDLFKYSINRKGKKTSTVKDEIEMVKSYLEIEKIRFGDRLQFDIDVDKDIEDYEIPLFLIQPLVENAVKHGISQNEGN
jgi:sensor histidine kinase YesM